MRKKRSSARCTTIRAAGSASATTLATWYTFSAAVRFMAGEPNKPWWKYTAERKRELTARHKESE
jgi:hypothetical protein